MNHLDSHLYSPVPENVASKRLHKPLDSEKLTCFAQTSKTAGNQQGLRGLYSFAYISRASRAPASLLA